MVNIIQILDSIVFNSKKEEIEHIGEKIELNVHYNEQTKELFVSHFYINDSHRRKNYGTKIYNDIKSYAISNENIDKYRFHIKKNKSSKLWLKRLGEEYMEINVGGVGTTFQVEYNI